jgi:hypothetical protein
MRIPRFFQAAFGLFVMAACKQADGKPRQLAAADTSTLTTSSDGALAAEGQQASAKAASVAAMPVASPTARDSALRARTVVRALYANRYASQSAKKMRHLIAIADSTEINAIVLDMKDEFGLNFRTSNPEWAKNAGAAGVVPNLKALLDTLKAHDILPIARLVVFKDSVTARVHPDWTIKKADGSVWRDKQGLAWVNPYQHGLWDYNIGIAEELAKLGFGEIQFDYIRFPEPYKSLPPQVFPDAKGVSKPDNLAAYLKQAKTRLNAAGVRSTADIFGLVTTVKGALEIGQWWEKIALDTARVRNEKLGISTEEHVRPWIQAFTLGAPPYGPEQIRQQKQAIYDAGFDGWVLWSPGSKYDSFVPALEKELVSRKKK